jgi:hypothetical protein
MKVRNPNVTKFKTASELAETSPSDVLLLDLGFDEEEVGDIDNYADIADANQIEEEY